MDQELNKADILIRLLKDGHISNDEFKLLYPENQIVNVPWSQIEDPTEDPLYKNGFIHMVNPDWFPSCTEPLPLKELCTTGYYLKSDGTVTTSNSYEK